MSSMRLVAMFPVACLLAVALFSAVTDATKCGTPDFQHPVTNRIVDIAKKKKARPTPKLLPAIITLDTYFCIVLDSGAGDISDATISKQMSFLNESFAHSGSRFRFQLKGTQRAEFPNATFKTLTSYENQLGATCRYGGLDALNIFVVPNVRGDADGIAKPFFLTGNSVTDGIFVQPSTLPGQYPDSLQDLGVTVAHEIGHWLGLMHPFQALAPYDVDPCNPANPNDYIADTGQMNASTPSTDECPFHRDTCPLDPLLDPTDNYMDYGSQYDLNGTVCKTRFTPEQVSRMDDVFEFYRIKNDICATNEFQFELEIKFDDFPEYTTWDIKYLNGTIFHQSVTDQLGSAYDYTAFGNKTITVYHCFPRGHSFIFDIYSSTGLGISSPGFYRITIDGKVFVQGGQDFKATKSIRFPVVQVVVPSGYCFSKENTVYVETKGEVAMSHLRIGDMVKSTDGTLVEVYSFGHYQPSAMVEYVQIHAKGLRQPLEISKDHLLFVQGVATPASEIRVGVKVDSEAGQSTFEVSKIALVTRMGAYAPFTTSGTMIVSGIATSSYVTLQPGSSVLALGAYNTPLSMHWLAHVFQAPHRLACLWKTAYCMPNEYTNEGISMWVERPLFVSKWLVQQNGVVMAVLLIPALCLGMLICLVECVCNSGYSFYQVAAIVAVYFFMQELRGQKATRKKAL